MHGDQHGHENRCILHQLPAPVRITPTAQQPAAQVMTACDVVEPDAGFLQLGQDPQLVRNPPPPPPLNPGDDLHMHTRALPLTALERTLVRSKSTSGAGKAAVTGWIR